ncbi:hypothetical protein WNZ14_03545 [Hoeflea sp. AS60]|uniref:hypothetical protein n=1 Tax=Hoeflea sp. AS60 TaxID=3135780 RepID=UPI003174B901
MRNILAVVTGLGLVFAAFAGLALALVLGTVAIGTIAVARMTGRFQPAMARASNTASGNRSQTEYRVWNDGRGTIIDM